MRCFWVLRDNFFVYIFFQDGRWGEVEIEKGPVDLFPTEPTDEDRQVEETLNHGFKELLGLRTKKEQVF